VHKLECPALCRIKDGVFGPTRGKEREQWEEKWFVPTPVRAAMQLLLRLKQNDQVVRDAVGDVPFINSSGENREGVLEGNVQGFRDYEDGTVWKDLGAQARAALKFAGMEMDGEKVEVAAEGVRQLLCMLQTNAFDRRDEDVGAAGVFLDVDLAMANHSCVPNAYVVFVGRTAVLRAERDISVGEEVEISYIGMSLDS
jgi:SET and MYND domain-containing protein